MLGKNECSGAFAAARAIVSLDFRRGRFRPGSVGRRNREKKIQYFLVRCFRLVGEEQVAGVSQHDQLCSRNPVRNQLRIAWGYESVRDSMNDEGGRSDLIETAITFPRKNPLELRHITFRRGQALL